MRYLLLFSTLLSTSLFALVSIAPVDIGSKPGISGNVSGSFSSKSGNTEKDEYSLGLRLQYDEGERYLTWGTMTYNYGESQGTTNEDRTYAHLRYIHNLNERKWCGELFLQTEQDEFKDINDRSLVGAGVRWRFFNSSEWGKGYAGLGGFYEMIEYAHPLLNAEEENERVNLYIAYTKSFAQASNLSYVGYYQPKFDDGSDYVVSQTLELIVPIYGKLNLSLTAAYSYDSRPPVGIDQKDTALNTSLVWSF
jgi:putative salt-induced outer membrane protein YdiY